MIYNLREGTFRNEYCESQIERRVHEHTYAALPESWEQVPGRCSQPEKNFAMSLQTNLVMAQQPAAVVLEPGG